MCRLARKFGTFYLCIHQPRPRAHSHSLPLIHICSRSYTADAEILQSSVVEDENAPKAGDLYIRSVRFSPDGKLLATGAEDRKIRVSKTLNQA